MAITVTQTPAAYTPNYNAQAFRATSNQTSVSDFTYRVIVTDLITGTSQTYNCPKRPVLSDLWFDAKVFTDQFIQNYVPKNTYGFQRCTDAIRKIRVNIGEYYSASYHAGSNYDYIIWNGVAKPLDWVYYDSSDYVYKNSTSNFKYITSDVYNTLTGWYTSNKITFPDKSHFIYALSSENNDLEFFRINTYDSGGTAIGVYDIPNPYQSGTTYTDKYVAIDVGHKGLTNISSSLYTVVSGAASIMGATVAYYDIIDGYTMPPVTARQNISRIYVGCEPTFTVYTIHYLAKSGNFETLNFNKMSELTETSEKTFYRQNPNSLNGSSWGYGRDAMWEKCLSSIGQESILLNTDWLSEDQFNFHREIFTSPVLYIDYGSTIGLVPVKNTTPSILINKSYNKKNEGITITVEPTYKNIYQHG
ncbi:MAG: hypothetical protein PX635_00745 [Nostocales cyanobacterium LE14-WE12]|jgi:hypothetical protein|nr:hypothetical protein [Nostocales cyanobacterium LE14-WE12]